MNAIVLTDQRWAIGLDGGPIFSLAEDLRRSSALTEGGTVIVGQRNLGCFPEGKPLPGRRNIIITANEDLRTEGCEIAPDPESAVALAGGPEADDIWLLGGGSVYAALLSRCRKVYRTQVDARVENADTFFPNLDKLPNWTLESISDPIEEDGLTYRFANYINTKL